jgi:hypothetical protein
MLLRNAQLALQKTINLGEEEGQRPPRVGQGFVGLLA